MPSACAAHTHALVLVQSSIKRCSIAVSLEGVCRFACRVHVRHTLMLISCACAPTWGSAGPSWLAWVAMGEGLAAGKNGEGFLERGALSMACLRVCRVPTCMHEVQMLPRQPMAYHIILASRYNRSIVPPAGNGGWKGTGLRGMRVVASCCAAKAALAHHERGHTALDR